MTEKQLNLLRFVAQLQLDNMPVLDALDLQNKADLNNALAEVEREAFAPKG